MVTGRLDAVTTSSRLRLRLPGVPLPSTEKVYVPVASPERLFRVRVVPEPVATVVLPKLAVTPAGSPDAESVTFPLKPRMALTSMV